MQGVLASRTRGCRSRQQRHMTPHASRATLLAAQLLCCLKVTMLVPKLRLVHQCDRATWASVGPAVASVLRPLARTSLPIQQPCRPSTAIRRAVNLLPRAVLKGRFALRADCKRSSHWQHPLRPRRTAGGCVRTSIIAEQPSGKKTCLEQHAPAHCSLCSSHPGLHGAAARSRAADATAAHGACVCFGIRCLRGRDGRL